MRTNPLKFSHLCTVLLLPLTLGLASVATAADHGPAQTLPEDLDSANYIKLLDGPEKDPGRIDDGPFNNGSGTDDNVVVPEPGTLALLGLGLTALGVTRRRKSRD